MSMEWRRCNACGNVFQGNRCPECGSSDAEVVTPLRIYLTGTNGFKASVHKSMVIGRDWCRVFEGYKYVSPEQFELIKSEEGWKIRGKEGAVHPTLHNGIDITSREASLKEGDKIQVGEMVLRVSLS
jgi:predicted component of type VI protein secretion system